MFAYLVGFLVLLINQNALADKNPPVNPGAPKVTFYNSRLAVITWKQSHFTKENAVLYKLQKRENDGEWIQLPSVLPKDNSQPVAMVSLIPYTKYSFRVKAENINGKTPYSEPSEPINSHEEIPEKAPAFVMVTNSSDTSISIRWAPPDASFIHGKLIGYKILYYEKNLLPIKINEIHSRNLDAITHTIKNLKPNTTYVISVKAMNNAGDSPAATTTASTKEALVTPSEPLYFTVSAIANSNVHLEWSQPKIFTESNGFYELNVASRLNRRKEVVYNNNETVEYILKDLYPSTVYSLWVAAYSGSQRGPPSTKLSVKTDVRASSERLMRMKVSTTEIKEKCKRICRQCFQCAVLEPLKKKREDLSPERRKDLERKS